jgi:beta-lactamase superfamily II metal-dependent hydrolase
MRLPTRLAIAALLLSAPGSAAAAGTLDIYVVDVEGGKAMLFVSAEGESVLVDSGSPGGRDVARILEVFEVAGVQRLDYLLSTHYHVDHIGGLLELSERVPIAHYVDHGPSVEEREQVPDFQQRYAAVREKARHTVVAPGDRIPVAGLDWLVVASAGRFLREPVGGSARPNPACAGAEPRENDRDPENGQSVGSLVRFGRFSAIDLGDLLWNGELELMCPENPVGSVDLLLVTHHGLAASNAPPFVHGVRPRVALMQNGSHKGGAPEVFETLRASPGLEDVWIAHWSHAGLLEHNPAGVFIANLSAPEATAAAIAAPPPATGERRPRPGPEALAHSPAHYLKVSAREDGSFTVANSRNGFMRSYPARSVD